jgi:hypothetical protein
MPGTLRARWILPFVLLVAAWALWRNAGATHWRTIVPGLEFTTLRGDPYCRRGSSTIAAVRFDPARVRLRVRHYTRTADRPMSIVEWQHETQAVVVFNAGQFYPDLSYMGLLVSDGRAVSGRLHPDYQAALVARADGSGAHVLDLATEPLDPDSLAWGEVAQSFMLFEHGGGLRVRHTDRISNRTVVADDDHGRVVVFTSEGGYTLADFGELLQRSPFGLVEAMSMDGGLEAEMVVRWERFRYASFGVWNDQHVPAALGAQVTLPAVITLEVK